MVFAVRNSFADDRLEREFVLREFNLQGEFQVSSSGLAKAIAACPALEELHSGSAEAKSTIPGNYRETQLTRCYVQQPSTAST